MASALPHQYKTIAGDPTQTRIYTLSNGLKVYLSVNTEKPTISTRIAVNTGHRNDPADCTGLAHYLEHLMFKGSHRFGTTNYEAEKPLIQEISDLYEEYRTLTDADARRAKYHEIDSVSQIAAQYFIPNEYDKLMAAIGSIYSNAYTSFDITCYVEDIPSNEVQRWAEIQSDRFQNLVLRGFHTELEAVYEEKNMSLTSDTEKAIVALFAKLYPTHSYGTQTTIGTQEHLKNPSLVAINQYYNKYYKPNNIAICMAGDFNPDEVISILEKEFGTWQPGTDTTPRQFPKQPTLTCPQDTTVVGQEQEQVMLAWRFEGTASLQTDTLTMISQVLKNGTSGLVDLDVDKNNLILESFVGFWGFKDYTSFILGGIPTEGQTLSQVQDIMMKEMDKLKAGQFDDDLLPAIVNNQKLSAMQQMSENKSRVDRMVDAFINGIDWEDEVNRFERMSRISKEDIIQFACKHFTDGYARVFKRTGEDTNIKKIEKPEITPISSNRDNTSEFLQAISEREVQPIQPKFPDLHTDLTQSQTKRGLPVLYVQNKENDLFTLVYRYEFGDRADVRYNILNEYLPLLGTSTLSNEQIRKQFYKLACSYEVSVGQEAIQVVLSGLQENMPQALKLLEQILNDCQPDADAYNGMVANILTQRADYKKAQSSCFEALYNYGLYGTYNDVTNIVDEDALKTTDPSVFTDLVKALKGYRHRVLYYGPASLKQLTSIINKQHVTARQLSDVPENRNPEYVMTSETEFIIAPYEANSIIMAALTSEGRSLDLSAEPTVSLFNEYFSSGMNGIVFQELRETRGLAYSASAYYFTPSRHHEKEYWLEHISTQNDKMTECINAFQEITDAMPQSDTSFQLAKQHLITGFATERTNKMDIIYHFLNNERLGIDYSLDQKVYEALPALQFSDINKFEQSHIKGKPRRYLILGNEKELDMAALEKMGRITRVTLKDIFGY